MTAAKLQFCTDRALLPTAGSSSSSWLSTPSDKLVHVFALNSSVTHFRQQQQLIEHASQPDPEVPALHFDTKYPVNPWQQYLIILKKFNITYWRTPAYNATRFSFTMAIALIFGTVYWKLGNKT